MRAVLTVALLVFALDQATKQAVLFGLGLMEAGRIEVAPPFLNFVMAWNRGVNFGLLTSNAEAARWALVGVAVAVSAALLRWARGRGGLWFRAGAGLVVGGALGNALDRVRFGAVADFLNMSCCGIDNPYVFNVADIAIFAGAAAMIVVGSERTGAR